MTVDLRVIPRVPYTWQWRHGYVADRMRGSVKPGPPAKIRIHPTISLESDGSEATLRACSCILFVHVRRGMSYGTFCNRSKMNRESCRCGVYTMDRGRPILACASTIRPTWTARTSKTVQVVEHASGRSSRSSNGKRRSNNGNTPVIVTFQWSFQRGRFRRRIETAWRTWLRCVTWRRLVRICIVFDVDILAKLRTRASRGPIRIASLDLVD